MGTWEMIEDFDNTKLLFDTWKVVLETTHEQMNIPSLVCQRCYFTNMSMGISSSCNVL